MVDQTKMNAGNGRSNQSTLKNTRTAARNVAHLLHDAVTLAELQFRLFVLDCQQLREKLSTSLIAIGIGVVLALSCVPVALAGIALLFRDVGGSIETGVCLDYLRTGGGDRCGLHRLRRLVAAECLEFFRVVPGGMDTKYRTTEGNAAALEPSQPKSASSKSLFRRKGGIARCVEPLGLVSETKARLKLTSRPIEKCPY